MDEPIPENAGSETNEGFREIFTATDPAQFDRIARMGARLFDAPIVLVSILDGDRELIKSSLGLRIAGMARNLSFAALVTTRADTLVITDAAADPRTAEHPLVRGNLRVKTLVGHPIHAPDGSALGAITVADNRPRRFSQEELSLLGDLARMAESEIRSSWLKLSQEALVSDLENVRRRAMVDSLTGVWNRETIFQMLKGELSRAMRENTAVGLILADIDHFKQVNDNYGHQSGDLILRATAGRLRTTVREYDAVGRYGGEEFMVVLGGCGLEGAARVARDIHARIRGEPFEAPRGKIPITMSLGVTTSSEESLADLNLIVEAADKALYQAKSQGRDCIRVIATIGHRQNVERGMEVVGARVQDWIRGLGEPGWATRWVEQPALDMCFLVVYRKDHPIHAIRFLASELEEAASEGPSASAVGPRIEEDLGRLQSALIEHPARVEHGRDLAARLLQLGAISADHSRTILEILQAGDERTYGEIAVARGFIDDDVIMKHLIGWKGDRTPPASNGKSRVR